MVKAFRFSLVIFLFALLVALRFFCNGLLFFKTGEYSFFSHSDEQIYLSSPTFNALGRYERIDFCGGEEEAEELLRKAHAVIKKRERIENIVIIYAYSPLILGNETVNGTKVNLMIALSGGKVAVGSPLIKGSF